MNSAISRHVTRSPSPMTRKAAKERNAALNGVRGDRSARVMFRISVWMDRLAMGAARMSIRGRSKALRRLAPAAVMQVCLFRKVLITRSTP